MKVDNIIIDIILALGVIFMLCMASDDFTLITATIMIVTAVGICQIVNQLINLTRNENIRRNFSVRKTSSG